MYDPLEFHAVNTHPFLLWYGYSNLFLYQLTYRLFLMMLSSFILKNIFAMTDNAITGHKLSFIKTSISVRHIATS